jgi:hypothetical protein
VIDQTISHHRILERQGGGMGVVLEAEDTGLGGFVELKFLSDGFRFGAPGDMGHAFEWLVRYAKLVCKAGFPQ